MATVFTIGHSTRSLADLVATLKAHQIQTLVDIRAFPMSRRMPYFNRESLDKELSAVGIRYVWMKALGGYRKKHLPESPNIGLHNQSFRNYADYMLTPEFETAAAELVRLAEQGRTAYMCAERMWFQCHRMLVSDWLVAHGHTVLHIDDAGPTKTHQLMKEARLVGNQLVYRGDTLF